MLLRFSPVQPLEYAAIMGFTRALGRGQRFWDLCPVVPVRHVARAIPAFLGGSRAEHYWEAEVADVEEATIKLVASRMAGGVSGVGVALPAGSVLPPAPPALDVPAAC
jgi:hypothetical protein